MAACLLQFQSTRKMGGESFSRTYEEKLQKEVQEMYESFLKRNESKHILNAYRTPAVLLIIMAVSYLFSSILDMLGIESLSQTAIFGLYIPLLCVCLWGYVRYSGNFRELGQAIDNVTTVIWENVSVSGVGMGPFVNTEGLKHEAGKGGGGGFAKIVGYDREAIPIYCHLCTLAGASTSLCQAAGEEFAAGGQDGNWRRSEG